MSLNPPQTVVVSGNPYSQCTFNDESVLKTSDYKIGGFKISLQQNKIVGISFLYQKLTEGRGFFCNDNIQKQNGNQVYEFYLEKDDFIQVIFGCYTTTQITQFGVVTYKGKQGIFGTDEGQKYKFLFLGFTFTLAFGSRKNNALEMLGFKTQKLPKEAVMQFVSPLLDILYSNTIPIVQQQQQNDYLSVEIKLPTTQQAIQTQYNQFDTEYSSIYNQQNNLQNFNTLRTVENIAISYAVVEEIQKPNKRDYTQRQINNNNTLHHVHGHGVLGFLGRHLFGHSQNGSDNHHHHHHHRSHHHHHHHGGGHHR